MKRIDETMIGSLKLEIHKALWSKIIPSLRAVILDLKQETKETTLLFFHDGELTEAIKKHYEIISMDIYNAYPIYPPLKYAIYRYDYPKELPKQSYVIYIRREPFENPTDLDEYEPDIDSISKEIFDKEINIIENELELIDNIKLSIYRGLWANVTPSLRKVTLQWYSEENKFIIVFYHDGPITASICNLYSCIHVEVEADFVFDPRSDFKIVRCDYPTPLPIDRGLLLYLRKEPFVDPF